MLGWARGRRGQATVELGLLLPVLGGMLGLTLQAGILISDQVNLEQYANEGALWATANASTATTAAIRSHIYSQLCNGSSGPPVTTGTKYCRSTSLVVGVTTVSTPTALRPEPGATSQVLGSTNCKNWSLTVTPTTQTVAQGGSATFNVTLAIGGAGSTSPSVTLSVSGYPTGTTPGFPTFNPPAVTATSTTSTLTFGTSTSTTPQTWNMSFGGLDQCGTGPANGLVASALTVTGTASSSPCSAPTVLSVSPSTVNAGAGTTVTITGSNFASGATVSFGATASTTVTFVSSTSITATVPTTLTAAVYNVTVTKASGCAATLNNGLTVSTGVTPSASASSPLVSTCAPGTGSYETRISITWNEQLLIPWVTSHFSMTAVQYTFCQ